MSSISSAKTSGQRTERRKSQDRDHSRNKGWIIFLVVITLLMIIGYFVTHSQRLYKPGDDIGYNLGLVGGIMMLSLLLYPLRKRVRIFRNVGLLPSWFKWHMIFGILAPALIVFHTTFHLGSINAAMAFIAMMLVSGSGIFGRFFYTKIHNGLYGRQASLKEVQDEMSRTDTIKSTLGFVPEIPQELDKFRARISELTKGKKAGFFNFATVGIRAAWLGRKLRKKLHHAMYAQSEDKGWSSGQLQRLDLMYQENLAHIYEYIDAVRDVAQFHTYERLFSWWHIFHIPLVYLLVFSGLYHVLSVHMY